LGVGEGVLPLVNVVLVIQEEHLQYRIGSLVVGELGQLVLVFLLVLGDRLVLVGAEGGVFGEGEVVVEVLDYGLHTYSIMLIYLKNRWGNHYSA
jgi:hypothetical protein